MAKGFHGVARVIRSDFKLIVGYLLKSQMYIAQRGIEYPRFMNNTAMSRKIGFDCMS